MMQNKLMQKKLAFDISLPEDVGQKDSEVILKLGINAFNADRLGYAMAFFQLAERKGHPDAHYFINVVRNVSHDR